MGSPCFGKLPYMYGDVSKASLVLRVQSLLLLLAVSNLPGKDLHFALQILATSH